MSSDGDRTGELSAPRPGLVHLAVVLAYALLTVVMTWPLPRHAGTAIPGDGFDGWQNYWNLWWLKTALVDRITSPFFTDILYAPTGVGLYFHTLNPLNGLMSMPVQLASGLIPAYNSVVLVSWVLSGYGAFLLCLWLLRPDATDASSTRTVRYAGAFLAGTVYTFAPFHMAHLLGHMQVMGIQWIPLYVLFLLRGIGKCRSGKPWLHNAALAGLFLVFNGLSDWYFVLYLLLFTGLVIVYYWLADIAGKRTHTGIPLGQVAGSLAAVLATPLLAALIFIVVLSPVLQPMVREVIQFDFMVRPATDLYILSASLADYAIPSRLHTLIRGQGHLLPGNQISPVSERTIAVGYTVMALALVAVVLRRRRSALWIFAAVFFLLLSLGPRMHLGNITWESVPADPGSATDAASWTVFGVLNRVVPLMGISRSVSRYSLMVQFSAAMLAGIGLSALLARMQRAAAYSTFSIALVLVLVLAEFWVVPYPFSEPDTPAFYFDLAQSVDAGAVLNLPMDYDRPGYLLYQTQHHKPLTVAYISRDDPRTLVERVPLLQHFRHLGPDIVGDDPVHVGPTVLDDLGVTHVILDRYKMPGGEEREYTEALAGSVFAGVEPVYEDDRLTVFEVQPVDAPVPYIELGALNWGPLANFGPGHTAASRAVGEWPACFTVRHAASVSGLRLDYWTDPGAEANLVDLSGRQLTALDPAPGGNTITVDVDGTSAATGGPRFCVDAGEPDTVRVGEISLSVP